MGLIITSCKRGKATPSWDVFTNPNSKRCNPSPTAGAFSKSLNTRDVDLVVKYLSTGKVSHPRTVRGYPRETSHSMSEPWKNGHDFVLYLNSGDRGTHALEPGVTTVRAAFRQDLEVPLTLDANWQVALLKLIYSHSYGNDVLKSPEHYHCQIEDVLGTGLSVRSMQLSQHKHFTHMAQVLEDLLEKLDIPCCPPCRGDFTIMGSCTWRCSPRTTTIFP